MQRVVWFGVGSLIAASTMIGIVEVGTSDRETVPLPPNPPAVVEPTPAPVPVVDPVAMLKALGERIQRDLVARYPGLEPTDDIPALGPCVRPDAQQRQAITARVRGLLSEDGGLRFGCMDKTGIVVDVQFDVYAPPGGSVGHWRILQVTETSIRTIASLKAMAAIDWMEWADQRTLATLALVDVDGDGARDIVTQSTQHEGGSSYTYSTLAVHRSRDGVRIPLDGSLSNLEIDRTSSDGTLVVRTIDDLQSMDVKFHCVTDTALTVCPIAQVAWRVDRSLEIARGFINGTTYPPTGARLPDRDLLGELLDIARIRGPERDAVLDAVPETSPAVTYQRELEAKLAEYLAQPDTRAAELAALLGDTECTRCPYKVVTTHRPAGGDQVDRTDRLSYNGRTLVSVTSRGPATECSACGTSPPGPQFGVQMYRHAGHVIAMVHRPGPEETLEMEKRAATIDDAVLYVFVDGKRVAAMPSPQMPWIGFENGGVASNLVRIDTVPYRWPDVPAAALAWLGADAERTDARWFLDSFNLDQWDHPEYRAEVERAKAVLGI